RTSVDLSPVARSVNMDGAGGRIHDHVLEVEFRLTVLVEVSQRKRKWPAVNLRTPDQIRLAIIGRYVVVGNGLPLAASTVAVALTNTFGIDLGDKDLRAAVVFDVSNSDVITVYLVRRSRLMLDFEGLTIEDVYFPVGRVRGDDFRDAVFTLRGMPHIADHKTTVGGRDVILALLVEHHTEIGTGRLRDFTIGVVSD